ncbi:glycosyltransferase family 4 protein [Flaviaesturariibacter amylovorans]|uniref:Glycosyltransferase n=1 Tax=Flaviaesturariibacter amylovorans TaxID=1084520 RepID=A0ABP8H383_9BACT
MMSYGAWIAKRKVEDVLLSPFILLGRLIARVKPLDREYRVFFFFPFYHTGGAEKVHAQIAAAAGGPDCILFFTRKSQNDTFLQAFRESGCVIRDVSRYTDNKLIYFVNFIWRGILSGYINAQKKAPVVFHGHSNIAYKTAPWIRKGIRQVDLVHSLNTFSMIRVPFIPFYHETVLISQVKRQAHIELYRKLRVPESFIGRLRHIDNAVALPERDYAGKPEGTFTVLFSGRPGPEKRLPLFLRIAERMHSESPDIRFRVMGAAAGDVAGPVPANVELLGNKTDPEEIQSIYWNSHVLLLTSETEGMPLVVPEAMGNGCAIVATPVGDLPLHIRPGEQGYLFTSIDDEERIIEEGARYITGLLRHPGRRHQIGADNIRYARDHFSLPAFTEAYRSLLSTDNSES